jgi:hypothetical protein
MIKNLALPVLGVNCHLIHISGDFVAIDTRPLKRYISKHVDLQSVPSAVPR